VSVQQEAVQRLVESAPPLRPDQIERLRALLASPPSDPRQSTKPVAA